MGQEVVLEGEGGVVRVAVPAGVVDAHGGAGGEFAGQHDVVVVERQRVAGAFEVERAEDLAAGDERNGKVGAQPGAAQEVGGGAVAGDARDVLGLYVRDEDRVAGRHGLGDQPVRGVAGNVPGRVGGADGVAGVGGREGQRPEHRGLVGGGPQGRPAFEDGVEDVDGGDVRELGHDDVGELAGGLVEIEGGADADGGVRDEGEAAAAAGDLDGRPVTLGDVDHGGGEAQYPAGGVLQSVVRHRPGVFGAVAAVRAAGRELFEQRRSGGQDLAHRRLGGLRVVEEGQRLADPRPMWSSAGSPLIRSSVGLTSTYRSSVSRTARPIGDWATRRADRARSRSSWRSRVRSVAMPRANMSPCSSSSRMLRNSTRRVVPSLRRTGKAPAQSPAPPMTRANSSVTRPTWSLAASSRAAGRPSASAAVQPNSCSACGLHSATRPSESRTTAATFRTSSKPLGGETPAMPGLIPPVPAPSIALIGDAPSGIVGPAPPAATRPGAVRGARLPLIVPPNPPGSVRSVPAGTAAHPPPARHARNGARRNPTFVGVRAGRSAGAGGPRRSYGRAMESNTRYGWARRLPLAGATAGTGAAAVAWAAPGGALGTNEPVRVTEGASATVYRSLARSVAGDWPAWAGTALEAASEGTLVLLVLLLFAAGLCSLRRRDAPGLAGVTLAAAGTVAAYALSQALKLLVDEERPCRAVAGALAVAPCPAPGDWSFPSNHATLAAALAVGVTLVRPRLAALALPVAVAAALLRVLVGVHYPHDVLAGAALGAGAVLTARILLLPATGRAASALLVRSPARGRRRDRAGLVGDHRRRGPVVDAEAGEDRADVGLHRSFGQVQAARDLPVGQSAAQEAQHVPFPRGQRVDAGAGRGTAARAGAGAVGREMGDDPGRDLR